MSGGSYDYLFIADTSQLFDRQETIRRMAERLTELGHHEAAKETEEVDLMINHARRRIEARAERLEKVWKAVEWYDSADWGIDSVSDAVAEYNDGSKAHVTAD